MSENWGSMLAIVYIMGVQYLDYQKTPFFYKIIPPNVLISPFFYWGCLEEVTVELNLL